MPQPESQPPNDSCPQPACPGDSSAARAARRRAWVDNLPYMVMIVLGAAIIWWGAGPAIWRWILTVGYVAYGALGAVWIMFFVCPWCHFYDTDLCPCGYGRIAARLRSKQDGDSFAQRFKRHIPVIVPLWFLPLIAGGIAIYQEFSWLMPSLLAAFVINSHILLPLLAKHYGCNSCSQKETCPWMGGCRE